MSDNSKIEWTDATWNPLRGIMGKWHCTKVSEGCQNCYAERMNMRFGGPEYRVGADEIRLDMDILSQPLRWKKPRLIFVCSMTDLFHEIVPFGYIGMIFDVMCDERCRQHTFQVLTKRPGRALEFVQWLGEYWPGDTPLSVTWEVVGNFGENIWFGVSVENQKRADERISDLLNFPAAVRFVSAEPLLNGIDLSRITVKVDRGAYSLNALNGESWPFSIEAVYGSRLDWVIVGGESGPKARPMHPDWARSIRDQCQAAGVQFFFKQQGEWTPEYPQSLSMANREMTYEHGMTFYRVGKKLAGRLLDGREWNEMPEKVRMRKE